MKKRRARKMLVGSQRKYTAAQFEEARKTLGFDDQPVKPEKTLLQSAIDVAKSTGAKFVEIKETGHDKYCRIFIPIND